jgi:hypothetical protein
MNKLPWDAMNPQVLVLLDRWPQVQCQFHGILHDRNQKPHHYLGQGMVAVVYHLTHKHP